MENIRILLPDGSARSFPRGTSPIEVARALGQRIARDALAAKVDDRLVDLSVPLQRDASRPRRETDRHTVGATSLSARRLQTTRRSAFGAS